MESVHLSLINARLHQNLVSWNTFVSFIFCCTLLGNFFFTAMPRIFLRSAGVLLFLSGDSTFFFITRTGGKNVLALTSLGFFSDEPLFL